MSSTVHTNNNLVPFGLLTCACTFSLYTVQGGLWETDPYMGALEHDTVHTEIHGYTCQVQHRVTDRPPTPCTDLHQLLTYRQTSLLLSVTYAVVKSYFYNFLCMSVCLSVLLSVCVSLSLSLCYSVTVCVNLCLTPSLSFSLCLYRNNMKRNAGHLH